MRHTSRFSKLTALVIFFLGATIVMSIGTGQGDVTYVFGSCFWLLLGLDLCRRGARRCRNWLKAPFRP